MKDGGPAFPTVEELLISCVKCSKDFIGKPWNISSRDYRCPQCKRDQQNAFNHANPKSKEQNHRTYLSRAQWHRDYAKRKKLDALFVFKKKARKALQTAVENGRIIKPEYCDNCHKRGRIEAHHVNYKEPLNVQWKCRPCHEQAHHGLRSYTA